MLRSVVETFKKKRLLKFISNLAEYLLFMAGALALLLMITLLSLLQVASLPPEFTEAVTVILFLPFIMDLLLISPNLPVILLFFFIIPLLLIVAVIFRILLARFSFKKIRVIESITGKIPFIKRPERKYGFSTLLAVSIGATVGPSTFVLSPYSVKYYGWYALPGMILASVSAVALAYGYSKMFYYSRLLKGKIVGGPSFVGNAFGTKHYLYIISRFTMWVGNVALAAFNLLIAIGLVTEYLLPLIPGYSPSYAVLCKILLFIFLSLAVLVGHKHWEKMVVLQTCLTAMFLALLGIHTLSIFQYYDVKLESVLPSFNPSLSLIPDFLMGVLVSAAYVYLMVFGFQEVQSLAENVKTVGKSEEEKLAEIYSMLKRAMVGGSLLSAFIFCFYISVYIALANSGVEIPETTIPALDIARKSFFSYLVTLTALALGVVTTYIPAFVAALKHLGELLSDVFLVKVEELRVRLDPYIVIFFMGLLLMTNAEYIIRLTDFAVLISLAVIAFSEYALKRRVLGEKAGPLFKNYRIFLTTSIVGVIMAVFSAVSQEIAVNSVVFMIFSTLIIMFFSYDLLLVELFTIAMGALSLIITPPLVDVIMELAGYGLATPTDIAIAQALTASIWILRFIFSALVIHLVVQYKREVVQLVKALAGLLLELLRGIIKKTGFLTGKPEILK